MGDNFFDAVGSLYAYVPSVALSINGVFTVVVDVIEFATVTVVDKYVLSGVVVGRTWVGSFADVHALATDDSDTPKTTFETVTFDICFLVVFAVIKADTATAIGRIAFVVVVDDLVVNDANFQRTVSSDTIAVVVHVVAFNDNIVFAGQAHQVRNCDSTNFEAFGTFQYVVANDNVVIATNSEVELGFVCVFGVIVFKVAVFNENTVSHV